MAGKDRNRRYVWILVVLVVSQLATSACQDDSENSQPDQIGGSSDLSRKTVFGPVTGCNVENSTVIAWRGIPFAAPPVNDLRWRAPSDPEPWDETIEATESGSPCLQFEKTDTWQPTGQIIGSEDCLYLDIYRKDSGKEDLPVYFWIHGGANKCWGAAEYAEHAIAMAEDLDVVVVVTQYRLGPFGWFRYAGLRDGDPVNESNSGNFGTLDQIRALKWVQNNIDQFGGDPGNVTIAGQSAGGHNVKNLLISPLAAGLYHKAVIQSGTMSVNEANDSIAEMVIAALQVEGDHVADQLRRFDAEAILEAGSEADFSAFADGYVIPDRVADAIAQGNYNRVPVIVGINFDEYFYFLPMSGNDLGKPNWGKVYDLFDPEFDPGHVWTYEEIFPPETDEEAMYEIAGTYASMAHRVKWMDTLAASLINQQDDVYGYVFKWAGGQVGQMEKFENVFGAAHCMEIPFFFGSDSSFFGDFFIEENEAGRKSLQKTMQTYLYNFMTTGDPGAAEDGTPWDPWSNQAGMYKGLIFDADAVRPQVGYIEEEMTMEDVDLYLAEQLQTLEPENAAIWGVKLTEYFGF